NAINNFIFELRESCRQIDDHKQHSINAIQCRLRSPIFGALTRLKCEVICCVWYDIPDTLKADILAQ
ncbi:MAG: hypothetical protein KGZ39_07100, partial [Simkania sp.]|nr:hypothetical protein [Simkania sp.]